MYGWPLCKSAMIVVRTPLGTVLLIVATLTCVAWSAATWLFCVGQDLPYAG